METLNWKRTSWNSRDFVLLLGQEIIGKLTFSNVLNFNAVYADDNLRLKFIQNIFGNRRVSITQDEKPIGEIINRFLGKATLELMTGEKYELFSSFWGFDFCWKNLSGETVIKYESTTMSKGTIKICSTMTTETERFLSSCGLFFKQSILKRTLLIIVLISLMRILSHLL